MRVQVLRARPARGWLVKSAVKAIDPDRPAARRQFLRLKKALRQFLRAQAPKIAAQLVEALGLQKARRGADPEATARAAAQAEAALRALQFDAWLEVAELAEPILVAMGREGVAAALEQIGVTAEQVQTLAGENVTAWARQRSAEMVGMRRTTEGELIANPNARWRIDESTREALRSVTAEALEGGWSAAELQAAVEESAAFSATRAEMVARTELAHADMAGAMEGYRASGQVTGKRWSTSEDDKVSDECQECADVGVIGLDELFPGGVEAPPRHPNCRCTVLPVLLELEP